MQTPKTYLLATSAFVGATALLAASIPAAAFAQTPTPSPQEPPTPLESANAAVAVNSPAELNAVVVTGTRLRLPDYVQANPVVSITGVQIENSGATNLSEYLQTLPALVGSMDLTDGADTTTPDEAGLTLLDLRNLGVERTLVLVNGRRHVASYPGTAAVDVNSIPMALVERVDVLTGGASAVYGADGVSGVVNFVMKKDFEGVDVRAQHSWTDEGGGGDDFFSALVGHNFAGGRGNITFDYEYNNQDRLTFYDRAYTYPGKRQILISNPADPGTFNADEDDPSIIDNILATNVRYIDSSAGGSIYTNLFAPTTSGVSFLGNGDPFEDGQSAGGFFMIGGSGSLLDLYNDDLIPGLERNTFNVTLNYELSNRARISGEAKLVKTKTGFYAQPSYDYGLYISPENPFLPASAIADAQSEGGLLTNDLFNFGSEDDPFLLTPWQAYGLPQPGVLVARDNFDLGTQNYDVDRQTTRYVGAFEYDITPTIQLELSAVHGRSEQVLTAHNVRINERFLAATDVVTDTNGDPVCRSNLDPTALPVGDIFAQFPFDPSTFGTTFTPGPNSGCLPLNIFGNGVADPAAMKWVMTDAKSKAVITQDVLTGYVTGDSSQWFSLPAGPVSFVAGTEYRKETSDYRPADIQVTADQLESSSFSTLGRGVRTKGMFDVKELFSEVSMPILRDRPFFQNLSLQAAYRWSDYSNMGETNTWNYGGKWQVNDWLMLRATKARAVRAPNISDLYLGRTQTFEQLADPCSAENLGNGENPALRAENCSTALTALGVDPNGFINTSSEATGGFISGNPDLNPETADTKTFGIVLTPRGRLTGLQVSVDYYDIQIDDAIQSFTAQTIVNNCYDLPEPNNFCDLIERTPGGPNPGRLVNFTQLPQNIATYKTRGIDYTISYRLDPADFGVTRDIGRFDFRLVGNILKELVFDQGGTAAPTNSLGGRDAPEHQVTFNATWTMHKLQVNYGFNWFEETRRFSRATMANEPDYVAPGQWYYPARELHDVQVRYDINDALNVYGGVNNLTDQQPTWDTYDYPVSPAGRTFYVGFKTRY